jgi:hypothetical protein
MYSDSDPIARANDAVARIEAYMALAPNGLGATVKSTTEKYLDSFDTIGEFSIDAKIMIQQYLIARLAVRNAQDVDAFLAMCDAILKAAQRGN